MDERLNPTVHSLMKQSIEHGRLAHAYLFEGEKAQENTKKVFG